MNTHLIDKDSGLKLNRMDIVTETMTVTPAQAKQWLEGSTNRHRRVSPKSVRSLADAMRNEQFLENGETHVKLDEQGNVLDGRAVLSAIIDCGKPQRLQVARNVDPATVPTMGIGMRRTPGDMLSIEGSTEGKAAAAAIRLIVWYERMLNGTEGAANIVPHYTVLAYWDKHPEVEMYAGLIRTRLKKVARGELNPAVVIALCAMTYQAKHPDEVVLSFLDRVGSGEYMGALHPAMRLLERVRKIRKSGLPRATELLAYTIEAFNAYALGVGELRYLRGISAACGIPKVVPFDAKRCRTKPE